MQPNPAGTSSSDAIRALIAATFLVLGLAAGAKSQEIKPDKPVISAYPHSLEGPGKMKLLPGYVAGLPQGTNCVDTDCGYIWNPQGLTISFDIGGMAGIAVGPDPPQGLTQYLWYGETTINGQLVRYAISGSDKPESAMVSLPASYANFSSSAHSESEVRTFLEMVLTYQGSGFRKDEAATVDGRLVRRDGAPLVSVEITLARDIGAGARVQTDAGGHFRFLGVSPGRYRLTTNGVSFTDCKLPAQHWRINLEPAQVQLRTFTVSCR